MILLTCKDDFNPSDNALNLVFKSEVPFEHNCINIAILSNCHDENIEFTVIQLPEILITYNSLIKLFFNLGKSFNPFLLNNIWNSIKGLNLANEFIKVFDKSAIYRNELSAVSNIKLHKECSFLQITTKANKIIALNVDELNTAISSKYSKLNCPIYVGINFLLFSEILQIGINITLPMLVSDIPETLYNQIDETFEFGV